MLVLTPRQSGAATTRRFKARADFCAGRLGAEAKVFHWNTGWALAFRVSSRCRGTPTLGYATLWTVTAQEMASVVLWPSAICGRKSLVAVGGGRMDEA